MRKSKIFIPSNLILITACAASLVACGGGGGGDGVANASDATDTTSAEALRYRRVSTTTTTTTTTTTPTTSTTTTPTTTTTTTPTTTTTTTPTTTTTTTTTTAASTTDPTAVAACLPSGKGTDYQVGSGTGQLATLDLVPWDKLVAGDTVRIFYSATPYRGHILLAANGTASAPVRVCGVKGPNGERPIIDGQNAVARRGLSYAFASSGNIQETRALIMIDRLGTQDWGTAYPTYIQVDGLEVRSQYPTYTFTNSQGTTQAYDEFGACIWVNRGKHITIADNILHDCTQGLFSRSIDEGAGTTSITEDLHVVGNYIYGNGVVGADGKHEIYTESVRPIFEFNRIGPQRAGALGDALKDRSVGTVVRYNYIKEGAHAVDLVEAEDMHDTALADPAYRTSFVYGNIITRDGASTGSAIHYGGDHFYSTPTGNYGEPFFRRGTLYFFDNTVSITGTSGAYNGPVIFQLSTTLETAQVWNNVFNFASTIAEPSLRAAWDDVNTTYWTSGGTFVLGKNWAPSNFVDATAGRTVPATLTGFANLIKGSTSPIDSSTAIPLAGSSIVDAAQADLAAVANYPVQYQFDMATFKGKARTTVGSGNDIGAVER